MRPDTKSWLLARDIAGQPQEIALLRGYLFSIGVTEFEFGMRPDASLISELVNSCWLIQAWQKQTAEGFYPPSGQGLALRLSWPRLV